MLLRSDSSGMFVSNLNPLCSDCRFYQRHSAVLWRHREPESVPLLRPEPHRGPLGLHHLPQVGVSPPPLRVELQIQQRSGEDDGTELRSVFTTGQSHTEKPLGRDSPTDQHVLQFSSVTQQETLHHAGSLGLLLLTKSRQAEVAKNSLPCKLTLERMIALVLKCQMTDGNCSKVGP